ncbi:MAG: HupE/UreJ family protein [Bryobacterales bacterium]|nr:HupE/UreJ family protein [Bryobacterales bacterium]
MPFPFQFGVGHHTRFPRLRLTAPAICLLLCAAAAGHDIPRDVTVQLFLKPSNGRMQILVRVPLKAIRDLEFPERENGYLDVGRLAPHLPSAATLWLAQFLDIREEGRKLATPTVTATQLSLESDTSFSSFEQAAARLSAPRLPNSANVVWNQLLLDVRMESPVESDAAHFAIRPGLRHLAARVLTVVRFLPPGGTVRAYEFSGDPGLVPLDPRWHQAAARFVELGFFHILDGADHLLFLLCLVIPFRRFRPLVWVVTAFTLAHSITLIGSAYNLAPDALWFPPLVETLIAASIVYMALENIAGGITTRRRWIMAFGFGLVHGFGFSFALKESLQFAGSHLLASLVSFNIGVEIGQLLVLALSIPLLELLFRFVVAERMGGVILSALVAHTAWHWMMERGERLRQFSFDWPPAGSAFLASSMRWAMWLLIAAGAWRLAIRLLHHRGRGGSDAVGMG